MRVIYMFLSVLFSLHVVGQPVSAHEANYEMASRFSPDKLKNLVFSTAVSPHWLKQSTRFWYSYETSKGIHYNLVDPVKGIKQALFDNVKLAAEMSRLTRDPFDAQHLRIEKLRFIKDETAIQFEVSSQLIEVEDEEDDEEDDMEEDDGKDKKDEKPKMVPKIWHFQYELLTARLILLDDYKVPEEELDWASISPDTSYVLFARNHNMYWMDRENYEKAKKNEKDSTIVEFQLTQDGEDNFSYERISRGITNVDIKKDGDKRKGVRVVWSPDSKKFVTIRSDLREVDDLWVINSVASPRPTLETYKYHMAGEKNAPKQSMYIIDFPTKGIIEVEVDTFKDQSISILTAPFLKKNRDDRLRPRLWLSPDTAKIYFTRTSRDLKRIDICAADVTTGKVEVIIEERLNTYIETRDLGLVDGGKEYVHWSERDGWAHFYLYDAKGNLKNQITSGPFHCQSIEGIDSKNRILYFTSNGKEIGEDPYYNHLYKINLDGTGLQLLNAGNFDHNTGMNDEHTYFVDNYSRVNSTPVSVLYDVNGNKVMDLETADLSGLHRAGYEFPEPFIVKAADGITDLYGVMYKPFDFDSMKQYPIIEYVYPGPQTEAVNKSFSARMDRTDRLAQLGFIVITVGNRGGHPSRSKWYHNYGYGNLRDYGLADKKAAAEQLAARCSFIDIEKVGIFGHSGGGFMSTAAMLVYPDFFKVAVSSAGNHDNSIYNRWWSEKHHGVKEITDDESNVSFEYEIDNNQELAKNLKGKLLICTGDIDNNVHPASTVRLAEALIKANKRFDFFLFPGQRHGFGDMNEYFFWLRGDYFARHLLGDFSSETDMYYMNRDKPLKR